MKLFTFDHDSNGKTVLNRHVNVASAVLVVCNGFFRFVGQPHLFQFGSGDDAVVDSELFEDWIVRPDVLRDLPVQNTVGKFPIVGMDRQRGRPVIIVVAVFKKELGKGNHDII